MPLHSVQTAIADDQIFAAAEPLRRHALAPSASDTNQTAPVSRADPTRSVETAGRR